MPWELTLAKSVDGVVPDEAETLSQLGDVVIVNGTAELLLRAMDWPAGFAAPVWVLKVKVVGSERSVGLLETTKVTGTTSGEFAASALVMEIVPWNVPAD